MSRCQMQMKTVLIITSIFAVACGVLANWTLIYKYTQVLDGLALNTGKAQLATGVLLVQEHMHSMEREADSYGRWLLAMSQQCPEDSQSALEVFNSSFFLRSLTHVQSPGPLLGFAVTWLFPAFSNNKTELQYLSAWKDVSENGTKWDYTYSYTLPDGLTTVICPVDIEDGQLRMGNVSNEVEYLEYYSSIMEEDDYWDEIFPWVAADGFAYVYLTYQRRFEVDGIPMLVQTYGSMVEWSQLLLSCVENTEGSHLLVVDGLGHLIATSLFEGNGLACSYVEGESEYFSCNFTMADNHSNPLIRHMSYATQLLAPGASMVASKQTMDDTSYYVVVNDLINNGKLHLLVVWIRSVDESTGVERRKQLVIAVVSCVLIAMISLCVAILGIFGLIKPLDQLMDAMKGIHFFQFRTLRQLVVGHRISEIKELKDEFDKMTNALDSFTRYVPRKVVRDLVISGSGLATLGLKKLDIVTLLLDIVSFTTICEKLDSTLLSDLLGMFFEEMTAVLIENGSTIDKFIGDAIMCFWGAPGKVESPATRACCSALTMRHIVYSQLRPIFATYDIDWLDIRIGIDAGPALCGNHGCHDRMNFTAIGSPVDIAGYLEGMGKELGANILLSSRVVRDLGQSSFLCRYMGRIAAPANEELPVFSLHGLLPGFWGEQSDMEATALSPITFFSAVTRTPTHTVINGMKKLAEAGLTCPQSLCSAVSMFNEAMEHRDIMDFDAAVLLFQRCLLHLEHLEKQGTYGMDLQMLHFLVGNLQAQALGRQRECSVLAVEMPMEWTSVITPSHPSAD